MISKFLDPKNDVAFHKIFGTEKNKDILIHFLNDMITFKEKAPIKDVTFLGTIQNPEIAAQKTSVVDILCEDEKGNQYIVEMQVARTKGFEKRAQYYASKAYVSQAHVGGEYQNLKEVIFLAISDFIMFPMKEALKSDHVILDKESYEHDLKDFSFTFLELPKFNKNIDELSDIFEKWVYFLKHAETTSEADLKKMIGSDEIIERAYEELNRFSWNKKELLIYERAEKREWDNASAIGQKYDEGLEKGVEIGTEKGIVIGFEKGRQERNKEIAKAMLAQGISMETIDKVTGLAPEDIESNSLQVAGQSNPTPPVL